MKTKHKIDIVCLLGNLICLFIIGCYWAFLIWLIIITLTSQPRGGIVALLLVIFIPYSVIFVAIMVDNIIKIYRIWRGAITIKELNR